MYVLKKKQMTNHDYVSAASSGRDDASVPGGDEPSTSLTRIGGDFNGEENGDTMRVHIDGEDTGDAGGASAGRR
jgi:hypothetical protein